jgi:hypothetical protein
MAVTATPVFVQTPKNYKVQILPGDGSALKTIAAGGANGTKITSIIATSSDTVARNVTWGITTGGVFFPLGTVQVPITAGQVDLTNVAVNLFDISKTPGLPIDSDGNSYVFLSGPGDTLQIKSLTTVTAAKEIDITANGGDF